MKFIQSHIDQIKQLCNQHQVRSLFAFGSVTKDALTPESDVDFLVDIEAKDPLVYADNYFMLKYQLEKLLKKQIDLLESKAIKNPFLRKEIDETKVLVYGK
jgi:predicted nucleotidyltransferase